MYGQTNWTGYTTIFLFIFISFLSRFCIVSELLELKESFSLFDRDGSGQIDETELKVSFSLLNILLSFIGLSKSVMNDCLGLKMTDEEIRELMAEVDTNKNGQIDFG